MTADVRDLKRTQFMALAQAAFERMFGADGQNGLVTFAAREQRACEVTDELARWLMAEHVAQDPAGSAGEDARCPVCQGPVQEPPDRSPEPPTREVVTRRGRVAYPREAVHCPRCRRIFFPAG